MKEMEWKGIEWNVMGWKEWNEKNGIERDRKGWNESKEKGRKRIEAWCCVWHIYLQVLIFRETIFWKKEKMSWNNLKGNIYISGKQKQSRHFIAELSLTYKAQEVLLMHWNINMCLQQWQEHLSEQNHKLARMKHFLDLKMYYIKGIGNDVT